jgi:Tol biopolymer transport system component
MRDGAPGGLYVMGGMGEAPRRLTTGGRNPSWSPDGKSLVYSMVSTDVPANRPTIGGAKIVQVDTGEVRDLTSRDALHPVWSPNGRFIAFWGLNVVKSGAVSSVRDIFVIAATGGEPWAITNDRDVDWSPTWAPDGSAIYFVSNRGGSMNLWRVAVDPDTGRATGPPEAVTTPASYVGVARMAGNGAAVVYESRDPARNIYRAPFDAARGTIGAMVPVTTGSRAFYFVDDSPDGKWLVLGTGFLQQEDLFISRPDGTELRQLTTDVFNDRAPQWSPKGDRISFYSDRTGKYEIWTITPSGQLTQLSESADRSMLLPAWSPSGRWISATNLDTTILFDPSKPWKEQTPEVLASTNTTPPTFTSQAVWSADEKAIAGTVGNIVFVYNLASRTFRAVPNAFGGVVGWLTDGRLMVTNAKITALIHPDTGAMQPLVLPDALGLVRVPLRLSRDERTLYLALSPAETDIWIATLRR